MGFRFRRSIRIAPGLRLNISKSGISTSIGGHGATYTIGPRGTRTSVGLSGTGLSWTSTNSHRSAGSAAYAGRPGSSPAGAAGCAWTAGVVVLIALVGMCSSKTSTPPTSTTATQSAGQAMAIYVNVSRANCRAVADPSGTVVARLARGTDLTSGEQIGGWTRVETNGRSCWVSSALLSSRAASTDNPAPNSLNLPKLRSSTGAPSFTPRHHGSPPSASVCPCSGNDVCIGPRGGRYCITRGGDKRYGV